MDPVQLRMVHANATLGLQVPIVTAVLQDILITLTAFFAQAQPTVALMVPVLLMDHANVILDLQALLATTVQLTTLITRAVFIALLQPTAVTTVPVWEMDCVDVTLDLQALLARTAQQATITTPIACIAIPRKTVQLMALAAAVGLAAAMLGSQEELAARVLRITTSIHFASIAREMAIAPLMVHVRPAMAHAVAM